MNSSKIFLFHNILPLTARVDSSFYWEFCIADLPFIFTILAQWRANYINTPSKFLVVRMYRINLKLKLKHTFLQAYHFFKYIYQHLFHQKISLVLHFHNRISNQRAKLSKLENVFTLWNLAFLRVRSNPSIHTSTSGTQQLYYTQ